MAVKKTFTSFVVSKCENGWTVEENWETPSKAGDYDASHSKTHVCLSFDDVLVVMDKITQAWKLN